MKKIVFLMMLALMASTAIKAQNNNATLLQPAGSYIYYGDQAFNLKQCVDFLATSNHQSAYETFQSGYKCYQAGWGLFGAGLGMDLIGSLIIAFGPKEGNDAMFYSGMSCLCVGAAAVLASIPTIFIGYARLNNGIDMFNHAQAGATPQAYWTIQGSQNGIGLALHF
ncbi:MAG: hypothetical protein IIU55_02060 [Paludibacteraceae bacterium]|jgi:hypothetical protein|nr:hypothetical protein [Paludibacteraceae bacterium]